MRGQFIFTALIAVCCAAPLKVQMDDLVERTPDLDMRGFTGKLGVVEVARGYVERRQDAIDA